MSCGCNNSTYSSTCCPEVPYPSISSESVPSLIDNLVYALYGTINKSIVNGRVIWDIPCDPSTTPAEVSGIPREDGEGLLCYIIRVLNEDVAVIPNVVQTNTTQTITGQKTFTQSIIATGGVTGDVTGDIYASNGITKVLENGTGANAIFTGNVTGNVVGNLTGNVVGNLTGNVVGNLNGNVTGNLTGNVTGNASGSASTLAPGKTIAISGAVTGAATSFNGGADISIPATISSGATITSPAFAGTATGTLTSKVVQGVTDGSVPSISSYIGELVEASQSSATTITTGAIVNAVTLSLGVGEWEVFGNASFNFTTTVVTALTTIAVSVSDASGSLQDSKQQMLTLPALASSTASPAFALVTPRVSVSVTGSSAPFYLVIKAPTFTGTVTYTGTIKARRIR
jgi:hypothetical protein